MTIFIYIHIDARQWSQVIPNNSNDSMIFSDGCVVFIKWYPPAIVFYVLSLARWVSFYKAPFAQLHRPGDTAAVAAENEVKGAEPEGIRGVDPKIKQILKW